MTARLVLEYDGGPFSGWARQPGRRTVQEEVERALATVLRSGVGLTVAGRTDRGVHAWAQVASYDGPAAPVKGLNALLPAEIAVRSCEPAPAGFSARRDATSRAYCYRVLPRPIRSAWLRGRALWWPQPVDLDALAACAAALTGRRDFTAFTPTDTHHVRFERDVAAAAWRRSGEVLELWIEADAFMRQMIRVLVGTMLEVAGGRRSVASFEALLEGAPRSRAGRTAPSHGLYLAGVGYGGARLLAGEPAGWRAGVAWGGGAGAGRAGTAGPATTIAGQP
jgi:tRNA pseudouridine38-40 synthase